MNSYHTPRSTAELVRLAHHFGTLAPVLLGHLRWCHHTPAASIVVVKGAAGDALATVHVAGGMAKVLRWLLLPATDVALLQLALLHAVEQACAAHAVDTLVTQCSPAEARWWETEGFVEQVALETWAPDPDEQFAEAERDEVQPLDAAHNLALLHLYRRATGEAEDTLLLEHSYVARFYAEGQRVAGILLPVLGQGLIVAQHPTAGLELQRWLLPVQPRLVVPEGNSAAADQLKRWGYDVVSTSLRMIRGRTPAFRPELVYAWPW